MRKTLLRFSTTGISEELVDALTVELEEIPGFSVSSHMNPITVSKDSDVKGGLKFTDFMEIGKAIKAFCLREKIISDTSDNSRFLPLENVDLPTEGAVVSDSDYSAMDSLIVKVPANDKKLVEALERINALKKNRQSQ